MTEPEVTFGDVELNERQRAEVRGALRRIRSDVTPARGAWPSQVDHISVTGVLVGGLSGALVLGIDVHSGNRKLARVAKIDLPAALAVEWTSFDELIRPDANIFFAPIVAATPDVVDPATAGHGPGAVVYAHAAQYAGRPDQRLRTLEDLVRAACPGSTAELDHVLRVIEGLLSGVAQVLHDKYEPEAHPSTLHSMNPALGPNVVLSLDEREHGGQPLWLPDDELLARTVGGPAQLGVGDEIALNHLSPDPRGRPGIARGDNIVVAIEPADDIAGRTDFAVRGRVVETRGSSVRERLLAALAELGPVNPADDGWDVAGTEVANPFGALLDVLTSAVPGRVRSVGHGDLNPRNALVVADQPCLIDYAHTANDLPQQADFCWLELGLVRDVFAALGFPALVTLQRWLALASRVLDHAAPPDAMPVLTALVTRQAPDLAAPFQVLLAIRRCGRQAHPERAGLPWHRDYLEQLLLAAHRAAKWTDATQTPARLRASAAVASVATEHLDPAGEFIRWADPDLSAALAELGPILPFTADDPVRLVRALAAAIRTVDGPTAAVLADARERLVRTRCAEVARSVLAERAEPQGYVDRRAWDTGMDDAGEVFGLIAAEPAAIVCGPPGSGKSAVLREGAHRLAVAVLDQPAFDVDGPGALSVRVPVAVDAVALARVYLVEGDPVATARALLADVGLGGIEVPALELGAPYLLVDSLDQLGSDERRSVLSWLSALRQRYPLMRVLLGQRQPDEPAAFAVLRLRDLDVAGMRELLHRALDKSVIRGSTIDRLLRVLLEEPEWQRLHPQRPGMLAMVARHVRQSGWPDGANALGELITEELFGAGAPRADDLALVCERIAVRSIDERTDTIAVASARWPDLPNPEILLDRLVGRDVLRRLDDRIGFADPIQRDYFAAHAILRNPPMPPPDLVRRPAWHDALRVFVTLPGVTDARDLVRAACRLAPELAAQLINDMRGDLDDIVVPFVASCRATLAGDALADDIAEAASALGALRRPAGVHALRSVMADADCGPQARVAALNAIAARRRWTPRADLGAGWLVHLFTQPGPVPLRVAALAAIAEDGLHGLELFVGGWVAPTEPWPVVRAAVTTLRTLGIALPPPLTDTYQTAVRQRLAEVDQALSEPNASDYLTERAHLVGELTGPDAIETLLAHRFAFLAGRHPAIALDNVVRDEQTPDPRPAHWDILIGDATPERWVRAISGGEPLEAAAAAHRLLRDARDHATRALAAIDARAPDHRLLIAAALATAAGDSGLAQAERLFRDVLASIDADRLTGAAALLRAIQSVRPGSALRLAWPAADLLVERDLAERHRWPWVTALASCRGDAEELSHLIDEGDDTAAIAEAALASRDFPRYALPGPDLRFEPPTRQRMLDRAPGAERGDWECARWALAAANMDLVEALPTLRAIAARLAPAPEIVTIGTSRSGLKDWAPLVDVLAVLGYLGRRAFDLNPDTVPVDRELDEVHRLLSDLDVRDAHHSIRIGRVVALAYLGDCVPLVHAIMADPALVQVGLDAIAAWAPYPHTPRSLRTVAALAEWLAALCAQPSLTTGARRALTQLTRAAERQAGVLFLWAEPSADQTESNTSGNHDEQMS